MRKFSTALVAGLLAFGPAAADDIKIGILLGFTGPIESLSPGMARGAELAFSEVSGHLLDERKVFPIRADSSCIDATTATAAAERLVSSDGVAAIMGADCSGVTTAVANNVTVPNGVVLISPSATSPSLSTINDNGYFFRTSPSDARQGEVLADIARSRGVRSIAVTYTNNDYGKGLADSFSDAFRAAGGSVLATVAHEDGKADYAAEVGALAATGSPALAVFGYLDQGGRGIIEASLDVDAFDEFLLADGMIGESLIAAIGSDLEGAFGSKPGGSAGLGDFAGVVEPAGLDVDGPFIAHSYDAAALIVLAIQAAGSTDRSAIQAQVMNVANAPGEKIGAGDLVRGLEILASGGDVDYVGATGVELNRVGEVGGTYQELEVKNGEFAEIKIH